MMTETKDNIVDRDQLQEAYIESIIDGMDHKSMYQFVYDSLNENLNDYTVDELITEVEDWSKLRKNGQELMPVFIPSSLS